MLVNTDSGRWLRSAISRALTLVGSWHYNLRHMESIWKVVRDSSAALDRGTFHAVSAVGVARAQVHGRREATDCGVALDQGMTCHATRGEE